MLFFGKMLASPRYSSSSTISTNSVNPFNAICWDRNTIIAQYLSALQSYIAVESCIDIVDGSIERNESQVERQKVL